MATSSHSRPSPPSKPTPSWKATCVAVMENISGEPGHPLQIALRTYSLCLSLSLSPVLLPTIFALAAHPKSFTTRARLLWRALSRELGPTGFASAITVAVGGGAALQRLWSSLERRHTHINSKLSLYQQVFLTNVISSSFAVTLLRWKRYRRPGTVSPTLDLSLLFLVRALDTLVQAFLLRKAREIAARQAHASTIPFTPLDTRSLDRSSKDLAKAWQNKVAMYLDALVFWASSARIMWCFFYQPQRLPPSFAKWINSLANVDERLLALLCALRDGSWSYIHGSPTKRHVVRSLVEELGRPPSWGDPSVLPAYGGASASEIWKQLGVDGRNGVGGLPCELVHGGTGASLGLRNNCIANAAIRAAYAFVQTLILHLPVHFLPILLTQPNSKLRSHRVLSALLSAMRSATFLSTFVSSCWFTVCFARTLVLARIFPNISHDVWDGPYGGTLAGSLVCGMSIWIESAKRRREVALYVLPKALRALIPANWLQNRHSMIQFAECLTFVLSLASLLTFSVRQPESLRGLSRWALAFMMKGPNASIWKKRRSEIPSPPSPVDLPIPQLG